MRDRRGKRDGDDSDHVLRAAQGCQTFYLSKMRSLLYNDDHVADLRQVSGEDVRSLKLIVERSWSAFLVTMPGLMGEKFAFTHVPSSRSSPMRSAERMRNGVIRCTRLVDIVVFHRDVSVSADTACIVSRSKFPIKSNESKARFLSHCSQTDSSQFKTSDHA